MLWITASVNSQFSSVTTQQFILFHSFHTHTIHRVSMGFKKELKNKSQFYTTQSTSILSPSFPHTLTYLTTYKSIKKKFTRLLRGKCKFFYFTEQEKKASLFVMKGSEKMKVKRCEKSLHYTIPNWTEKAKAESWWNLHMMWVVEKVKEKQKKKLAS